MGKETNEQTDVDIPEAIRKAALAEKHRAMLITALEILGSRASGSLKDLSMNYVRQVREEMLEQMKAFPERRELLKVARLKWLVTGGDCARRLLDPAFFRKASACCTDPVVAGQLEDLARFVTAKKKGGRDA